MKVGILTVFDAVNYGSFLQAFTLQETIRKIKYTDVIMIKVSSLLYERWRATSLYTYNPKKMSFKRKLRKGYSEAWKKFKVSRKLKGYDLVVIGSDEMWELNNITMKSLPAFFGNNIKSNKKVTYAVSSNSTTKEQIENLDYIKDSINDFDKISVRDTATLEAYSPYINQKIEMCLDPTLLIDLYEYAVKPQLKDYILIYSYSLPEKAIKEVKKLASVTGKKIVCAGQNFDWADECIAATPFEFLGLISEADFIVSDTFHGTTLSIALKKQFVSYAYKTKVFKALELFNILDRNAKETDDLMNYYNRQIDYELLYNDTIIPMRNRSMKYLEDCLEN